MNNEYCIHTVNNAAELADTVEEITTNPGTIVIFPGCFFHGGHEGEEGDLSLRLHAYLTTREFYIGDSNLEQGWFSTMLEELAGQQYLSSEDVLSSSGAFSCAENSSSTTP